MGKNPKSSSGMNIPDYQFEAIARVLLPKIRAYYETEEGQRAFAEWKAKKEGKEKELTNTNGWHQ